MDHMVTLFEEHKDLTSSKLEEFSDKISELKAQQDDLALCVREADTRTGSGKERKKLPRELCISFIILRILISK